MKPGRAFQIFSLATVIPAVLTAIISLSLLFYFFWQRLDYKVEKVLRDQFNQQQLMLAKKIADNVESYFDFLENILLGYAGAFQVYPPESPVMGATLAERFERHKRLGILETRHYNDQGVLVRSYSTAPNPEPPGSLTLPAPYLKWARDRAHRGRLFLSKTYPCADAVCQGRLAMRFFIPLYWKGEPPLFAGVMELLIDPFFIAGLVIKDVRSGRTGYAWIVDQDLIMLAHYEKEFVGHEAMQVRLARNPNIIFRGLRELHARLLAGEEGMTEYDSGWHRQRLGQMPKLAAFTPIRFDRGLIQGITELEDPAHNLWGVCVVAPVEEVSGAVGDVLRQESFLGGLFFLVVLMASGVLIGIALLFNRTLAREVEFKTRELEESHEHLLRSERFAAVGEAATYVSHEIKNPLMVIGGLAQQLSRRLDEVPEIKDKLVLIQTEVRRLENFLGDLRDFTRPALPVKESVDLNRLIREVETLLEGEAAKRGVKFTEDLDPALPEVEADPNQMKQVLLNFMKNALEALDSGGEISIASGLEDRQVWFTVHDTGSGMAPEVLAKIFNPFFTTKEKGTGLGLAVIHKIITDHHGTVTVDSTPEQGTTFTVSLPRAD